VVHSNRSAAAAGIEFTPESPRLRLSLTVGEHWPCRPTPPAACCIVADPRLRPIFAT